MHNPMSNAMSDMWCDKGSKFGYNNFCDGAPYLLTHLIPKSSEFIIFVEIY